MNDHSPARTTLARRDFLKTTGSVGLATLTIGFEWMGSRRAAALAAAPSPGDLFAPNAFLRIGADGSVTVIAKHVELGQGAYTGIATVVAEELDADWTRVRVESAPADAKRYANLAFGTMQATGGSSAMANSWNQLREAGAKGRAMLLAAAAQRWHVPVTELSVEKGIVYHRGSQRQAAFGSLVKAAAALPVPDSAPFKDPKNFSLIGHPIPRIDVAAKCDGSAQFTLDVALPGTLVALLKRPPLFGATVKSFDAAAASAVPGVVKVVEVPRGVAVVAKNFWAAKLGRDALTVIWDDSAAEKRSSSTMMEQYRRLADQPAASARNEGDVAAALRGAAHRLSAEFEFPYLAHAPMEPLDAVVKLDAVSCEIWAGDQFQTVDQANAARTAGLTPQQVSIHTLYAGGSFGRRANAGSDYIVEAVSIAKACGADGTPIKLQWTREDDIHGGLYRPMFFHKFEAGLNEKGELTAWKHVMVGQSIMAGTPFAAAIKDGIDPTSVEGAANIAYAIPNITVDLSTTHAGVPVLWWRVVGSSHTTFAVESFIDEAAHAAGEDPFAFRRKLLGHDPRMKAVLELAAGKAGWSAAPLPKGKGRGIAVAQAFKTYVAQVAEVSVGEDGRVKVDRVVCAVDCGTPINPDIIVAQMEGGIGFGLGAALYGSITLKDGRIEQDNFNSYRVLRMNEMPKVEVYIVPSTLPPTGVGEPGVAPVGPAVANAVFAATGKRVRVFPMNIPAQRGRVTHGALWTLAAIAVAALAVLAYIATGPGPTAFAGGTRVALTAYHDQDPSGVPAELKSASLIERGEYLTRAADCAVCHTAKDGVPFAGGRAFVLPFGTLYSTNITPDRDTGIGTYSDADFLDAVHKGLGRAKVRLYPAMPYASYTYMSDADALAIKAYLFSLEPVHAPAPVNTLSFPFNQRSLMSLWSLLFNADRRYEPDTQRSAEWNRGAYLTEALGHCGECHTPRNLLFALNNRRKFAGALQAGWRAYNITSDRRSGVGSWSDADLAHYLSVGHAAGRGTASGPMGEAVDASLSHLKPGDINAMVAYLRTVPGIAVADLPEPKTELASNSHSDAPAGRNPQGRAVYEGACAGCHGWSGVSPVIPLATLTGTRAINDPTANNVAQVILAGGQRHFPVDADNMPAFGGTYSNAEIASVANYVTARFGARGSALTPDRVARMRAEN